MEEQIINYETAVLAKEKGFNLELKTAYIGGVFFESEEQPNGYDGFEPSFSENWNKNWSFNKEGYCSTRNPDNIEYFEACSAPTQSLLQKWLRERHNIHLVIQYSKYWKGYQWRYDDWRFREENPDTRRSSYTDSKTYEEALEVGLQEALKLIK